MLTMFSLTWGQKDPWQRARQLWGVGVVEAGHGIKKHWLLTCPGWSGKSGSGPPGGGHVRDDQGHWPRITCISYPSSFLTY